MAGTNTSLLLPTLSVDMMPGAGTSICEHEIASMSLKSYMLRLVARKDEKR